MTVFWGIIANHGSRPQNSTLDFNCGVRRFAASNHQFER